MHSFNAAFSTLAIYKEYIIDEAINGPQFLVLAQSESLLDGCAGYPMCSCSKARSCPSFLPVTPNMNN